jgi:hypothetical protein
MRSEHIPTFTADLRKFADWLDDNPAVLPHLIHGNYYLFSYSEEEFRDINRLLGTFEKKTNEREIEAVKDFGSGMTLRHSISHERVCEKRVVGTRTVTKYELPEGAPAVVYEEVEVEEEITEWVCPENWK